VLSNGILLSNNYGSIKNTPKQSTITYRRGVLVVPMHNLGNELISLHLAKNKKVDWANHRFNRVHHRKL